MHKHKHIVCIGFLICESIAVDTFHKKMLVLLLFSSSLSSPHIPCMSGQQWLVTSCCSSGCGGGGDHCSDQVTRGEPAAGVTPTLSLWSLLGCTRHSATPTTTLIFHGSFTLHWHFSQISNIKNPNFTFLLSVVTKDWMRPPAGAPLFPATVWCLIAGCRVR